MILEYGPVEISFLTFLFAILVGSLVALIVAIVQFIRGNRK